MGNYSVHSLFSTIQGEGYHAGRRAIFVRLAGCNAWNGRPEGRAKGKGACSKWCDTAFVGGDAYTTERLCACIEEQWACFEGHPRVVLTGGEPALQIDEELMDALHARRYHVAVETNGSVAFYRPVDTWVTCSPKRGMPLVLQYANELKVVLPGGDPNDPTDLGWTYDELRGLCEHFGGIGHRWVQPQDPIRAVLGETHLTQGGRKDLGTESSVQYARNVNACLDVVKRDPRWRIGVQGHKLLGLA